MPRQEVGQMWDIQGGGDVYATSLSSTFATVTTLIGAKAGKQLAIVQYVISAKAAADFRIVEDNTAAAVVVGPYFFAANGGINTPLLPLRGHVATVSLGLALKASTADTATCDIIAVGLDPSFLT